MAKTKTTKTAVSVSDFINDIPDETKRNDSIRLVEIYKEVTGFEPYMWGPTIIGFGSYHYKYESGHEGDAPLAGFSPRKPAIVFYLSCDGSDLKTLTKNLGKIKTSKSCTYVKKLADINIDVLKKMIKKSIESTKKKYGTTY